MLNCKYFLCKSEKCFEMRWYKNVSKVWKQDQNKFFFYVKNWRIVVINAESHAAEDSLRFFHLSLFYYFIFKPDTAAAYKPLIYCCLTARKRAAFLIVCFIIINRQTYWFKLGMAIWNRNWICFRRNH